MLGLEDKWVLTAYLLCLASTGLCVVYGFVNWNRGGESSAAQNAPSTAKKSVTRGS